MVASRSRSSLLCSTTRSSPGSRTSAFLCTGSANRLRADPLDSDASSRDSVELPMRDRNAARRAVDLSHEVVDGMITHPGIPGPTISTFLTHEASVARYAPGTTFEIGRIYLVANTGTYLDTPAHRFRGRSDLAGLALERVVDLPGVLVDCRDRAGQG